MKQNKPVYIITGYLGSGKTTLMNELLKDPRCTRTALIVNDMGSVNIDARLIRSSAAVETDLKMLELQNGCICCTLRDEFMVQLEQLAKDDRVDRILVEASGISNPASIAEGFLAYEDLKQESAKESVKESVNESEEDPLEESGLKLRSIISVVDADRVYSEFITGMEEAASEEAASKEVASKETVGEEATSKETAGEEAEIKDENGMSDPDIINLVMDQIEFCNVIILNKCDLLSQDQLSKVKKVIRQLQSEAVICESVQGKVNPDLIFQGAAFDYDAVMNSSMIQKALAREQKMEEAGYEEYGVTSFVYEERCPFDYDKFMDFMEQDYPETMIRAKGYIWFAEDDMHVQLFEQAGRNASVSEVSNWLASFSEKDRQDVIDQYPEVLDDWDPVFGDRLNQIVMIGRNYDEEKIKAQLDQCIVKEWKPGLH